MQTANPKVDNAKVVLRHLNPSAYDSNPNANNHCELLLMSVQGGGGGGEGGAESDPESSDGAGAPPVDQFKYGIVREGTIVMEGTASPFESIALINMLQGTAKGVAEHFSRAWETPATRARDRNVLTARWERE